VRQVLPPARRELFLDARYLQLPDRFDLFECGGALLVERLAQARFGRNNGLRVIHTPVRTLLLQRPFYQSLSRTARRSARAHACRVDNRVDALAGMNRGHG
jgi:hypothetical protein